MYFVNHNSFFTIHKVSFVCIFTYNCKMYKRKQYQSIKNTKTRRFCSFYI